MAKQWSFVDRTEGGVPAWSRDTHRLACAAHLTANHALASAAIPIMFPAVPIDNAFYCDGGLRQNTPLSPALRLGADRVLVVAVGHGHDTVSDRKQPSPVPDVPEAYPGPTLLLGKVLNALLLDHLDYDLAQLEGLNRLIEDGQAAFGPSFLDQMSKTAQRIRGASYRRVDPLVIRPSRDLGEMAAEFIHSGRIKLSGSTGWILKRMGRRGAVRSSRLAQLLGL